MNRTDIHCHLLPGVDDGPADLGEALALAADAAADGTRTAVATPHVRPGYVDDPSELPGRVAELQRELRRESIPLELHVGGELAHTMVSRLRWSDLDTIAQGPPGGRWILLEAPFAGFGPAFHDAAQELRDRGFAVVIAHPERALGALEEGFDAVRGQVLAGSALQVNVWSLAGRHGKEPRDAALRLIRAGLVTAIASDGHPGWRRPLLSEGIAALLGEGENANALAETGPRRLLEAGLRGRVERDELVVF